jgi:ABC-type transporter Mla maintaining outer membrane lipid asymmetry ATPase subunit MlaF
MTVDSPLIHLTGIVKKYQALRPLRIAEFSAGRQDRLVLSGFDAMAAEMFVYLVTGAALPDEGGVVIAGRNTRDIATDTEWLASLDRFGIVTHRAILLESTSVASNLALPLTVAIDPMTPEMRARVEADAADVGLPREKLDGPAHALTPAERLRLHLARALAVGPDVLMLEHPTSALDRPDDAASFGETLKALAAKRGFGFVALSEDETFGKASEGRRLRLNQRTGKLGGAGPFGLW